MAFGGQSQLLCLCASLFCGWVLASETGMTCDDNDIDKETTMMSMSLLQSIQLSPKSSGSAETQVEEACEDLPNWKDSDGDTCSAISSAGQCKYSDNYMSSYGDEGATAGAQQACCACGGGMRTQTGKQLQCIDYSVASNKDLRSMAIVKKGHCYEKTDTRGRQGKKLKEGRMLFFGDSDIEYWKTEKVFSKAVNCGVGGSTAYEASLHAEKTARELTPKDFVVIVAGENDMQSAVECADTIFENLKKAVLAFTNSKYHPTVIMFSTKPEPGTTELHSLYRKYDALCKDWSETPAMKGHFKFIHAHALFKELGNPGNLYDTDDLHMSKTGYSYWNQWLKSTMDEGCHDYLGVDGNIWKDKDGDVCSTIAVKDWCHKADEYKVDGIGAKRACCGCGGGCDDIPGWKDSEGDTCSKIVKEGWCDGGDDYKVDGVGAKDACCGCGGGLKRQPLL